jgi:riboflavin kinase/FMN adenylyltransferase
MIHTASLEDLRLDGTLLTIGAFDGVHRGHQALIGAMVAAGQQQGKPVAVITFYPHPAVLLRGIEAPFYLTAPEGRAELLNNLGVEVVVTLPFTRELAQESAAGFLARLHRAFHPRELWVGHDFALGKGRQGDIPYLRRAGEEIGFVLRVVEALYDNGQVISSSLVRARLAEGDVSAAAQLLGRAYGFSGQVVHGDGRGRSIGIPTANIQAWEQQLLPALGVYATWVWVEGIRHPAVTNVGFRPTFNSPISAPRVEALLLDFDQDLYDKTVRVEFVAMLRAEKKFESVAALLDQINADRCSAQAILDQDC